MSLTEPGIIAITGIMASGKSTVAQAIAERLPKSVHLRGDVFRRMIVKGRQEMEAGYTDEALAQLHLRYHLAAMVAREYCAAGFTVVYQDIILGEALTEVVNRLRTPFLLYLVVLSPAPEVVALREAGRDKVGYGSWTPAALDDELRLNTPRLGLWLDTSTLTVEETVDTILARLPEAKVE